MKTLKVKSTTAYIDNAIQSVKLHYGIHYPQEFGLKEIGNVVVEDNGATMTFDHLLSLILYTDFCDLCTHFSSTFRPQYPFEPLSLSTT